MNKKSLKLLTVLSACQPEDRELERAYLIQTIMQSDDYAELQNRSSYKKVFESLLSKDKLQNYSIGQLRQLKETLPFIADFLQNLIYSLKNGICPTFTEAERPNFFNKEQLTALTNRLEEGTNKNYCNIEPADCMSIFAADTVKSIKAYFKLLPRYCEDYDVAIAEVLENRKYCISSNEVQELEQIYHQQVNALMVKVQQGKNKKFYYCMLKLCIALICLLIPWFAGSLTGNISTTILVVTTLIMLIVGGAYVVKG